MPGSTFNMTLLEAGIDIVPDQINVNIGTGGGGLTGIWVSMVRYHKAYWLIQCPGGNAGDDLTISPLQATTIGGAGSKALAFSRFWTKAGATMNTVGVWTQYDLTTPSSALVLNSVTGLSTNLSGQAETAPAVDLAIEALQQLILVEISATDLDLANNFAFVSAGLTQLGSVSTCTTSTFWILKDNKYPQQLPLSPLV